MSTQHKYEQLEGFIVTEANIQCGICGSRGGESMGWMNMKHKSHCIKKDGGLKKKKRIVPSVPRNC